MPKTKKVSKADAGCVQEPMRRRSLRLKDTLVVPKAEPKPKPKKAAAKKAKDLEKAEPEEKALEAPAENGETKTETNAPAADDKPKDEAAE